MITPISSSFDFYFLLYDITLFIYSLSPLSDYKLQGARDFFFNLLPNDIIIKIIIKYTIMLHSHYLWVIGFWMIFCSFVNFFVYVFQNLYHDYIIYTVKVGEELKCFALLDIFKEALGSV